MTQSDLDALRRAHEALSRRVAEERLAFADRVQEVLDHAQHLQAAIDDLQAAIDERDKDVAGLRARIEELHAELVEASKQNQALITSRSFRYTRPFRELGKAIRKR